MSIKAMSMVWERSKQSGSALLMLLAIADYAKDDGTDAWPSLATLARKTRMSRRNAIEIVKKLEEAGELQVRRGAGPRGCNFYDIISPSEVQFTTKKPEKKVVKPDSPPLVNPTSPPLVKPDSPPLVNPTSPEPLSNHHVSVIEPSGGETPAPDYLDHVLEHSQKPDRAGIADPSQDIAAYMEYASQFLKAYHDITSLHAAKSQKHKIEQLAEKGSGLEFWRDVVDAWVGAGWNPRNIDGMIDCYLRGEIPSTGKNGGKHAPNNRTGRVPSRVPEYSVADPAAFGEQLSDDDGRGEP